MKYYLDTEFLEGTQEKRFLGFKYGKTKPTIDLISIGLVSEDDREYYAISKDFNIDEAWNRYDLVDYEHSQKKVYWIRDNVLEPIYFELFKRICRDDNMMTGDEYVVFTLTNFKKLIDRYGKSNEQIAKEVVDFTFKDAGEILKNGIEFYTYFGDYDWVAFCWLFGKMINLPKGFPMYSKDLKQIYDDKEKSLRNPEGKIKIVSPYPKENDPNLKVIGLLDSLKDSYIYPKQDNEHNALSDAKWNKKLHEFLNNV